jgi:glycine cleavage system transcriptional repressor
VQVEVDDSPHLIERFTALFDSHQMNVAELVSREDEARQRRAYFRRPGNRAQQ